MRAIRLFGLIAAVGAVLALPAPSFGVVTIGSNLGRPVDGHQICPGGPCTFAITALDANLAAPAGIASPVNGTLTTWRISTGAFSSTTSIRVIRPLGGGLFTGAATSASVTPPLNATTPFSTQLPIRIGDLVGIDCCNGTNGAHFRDAGGEIAKWNPPPLADGAPGRAPDTTIFELLINADIEPTSALANVNAKAKKGGKVRVSLETPNAGSLVAGDKRDLSVKAAAAAKKQAKLLKKTTVQAAAGGPLSFVIKPTKAAKSALADGRSPRAKLKLVFTPTGGSAYTQVVKVKLKG